MNFLQRESGIGCQMKEHGLITSGSSRPLAPTRPMPCVASAKEAPNDNWKME